MNTIYSPNAALNITSPMIRMTLPGQSPSPRIEIQIQGVAAAGTNQRLSGTDNSQSTSVTGKIQGLDVKATVARTADVNGNPTPRVPPGKALPLGRGGARDRRRTAVRHQMARFVRRHVGAIVTFFIRYTNQGTGRSPTSWSPTV